MRLVCSFILSRRAFPARAVLVAIVGLLICSSLCLFPQLHVSLFSGFTLSLFCGLAFSFCCASRLACSSASRRACSSASRCACSSAAGVRRSCGSFHKGALLAARISVPIYSSPVLNIQGAALPMPQRQFIGDL
ncbi:hypothetical protein KCP69_06165 [Salmonella enterica subsp. enterica]|nr:hypothetical protein KCP69_06165 [Salmonella enterica subsp. enterica]